MKKEYIRHLEVYGVEYYYSSFSSMLSLEKWGNRESAEAYLEKYWLQEEEYLRIWKPIQNKIFQDVRFPDMVFRQGFNLIALRGSCLFVEEDFLMLQKSLLQLGEEHFVVIQHSDEFTDGEPMFRMKFPVNITWAELNSGNYISAVLIGMVYNTYYIFGIKGNWGKYVDNDDFPPLDIIGFKMETAAVFKKYHKRPKEEEDEINGWVPEIYRNLIL